MNLPDGVESLGWQPHIGVLIVGALILAAAIVLTVIGRFTQKAVVAPINKRRDKAFAEERATIEEKRSSRYDFMGGYGFYSARANTVGDGESWWIVTVSLGALAIIWGLVLVIALIPYDGFYWQWYKVSGQVESVEPVLTATDGNAIDNDYLLTIEGNPTVYRMTDPRVRDLIGQVELLCSPAWVQTGYARAQWSCEIRESN